MRDGLTYCERHRKVRQQEQDARRGSAHERGYTGRWAKARATFLRQHSLCECDECGAAGRIEVATVVDHRIPHRGNQALFWDSSNWMAMTKRCHDRKTAREDGGFGRVSVPS